MTSLPHGLLLHAEPPPLRLDDAGVLRIGESRFTLDLIVEQYESGLTAEDVVRAYDTLVLADLHSAIGYYLRHKDVVGEYLNRRRAETEALRERIESERPPVEKEDLMARRTDRVNASTGQ